MATATYGASAGSANIDFSGSTTGNDPNQLRLFTAASGGVEIWRFTVPSSVAALTDNQFYRINSGALSIALAAGSDGGTEAFAQRCLTEALTNGGNVWAELYTGNTSISDREALTSATWVVT